MTRFTDPETGIGIIVDKATAIAIRMALIDEKAKWHEFADEQDGLDLAIRIIDEVIGSTHGRP